MNLSIEMILSIIALITSILSPIAVVFIQKHFDLKMKRMDVYEKRKLDAIENYTRAIQSSIVSPGTSSEYRQYGSTIRFYAPESIYDTLDQIDTLLDKAEYGNEESMAVRRLLTKVLQSMKDLEQK